MTKLVSANDIKLALMMKYRFSNGVSLIATECGRFSSDVLMVDRNLLVEFEVKISLNDFKADFKKDKHNIFESCRKSENYDNRFRFTPHQFYFVVPESLVEDVSAKLIGKPYGLISVKEVEFTPNLHYLAKVGFLRVVKRATLLRKQPVTIQEKEDILMRMSSELIREKIKQRTNNGKETNK